MSVAPASGQSLNASIGGKVTSIVGSASWISLTSGPASSASPESSPGGTMVDPSTGFGGSPSPGTKSPVRLPQATRTAAESKAEDQGRMGPHDDARGTDRQARSLSSGGRRTGPPTTEWPCYSTPVTMAFPTIRPRRLRSTPALRALVRETTLTPRQLVWPLFFSAAIDAPSPIGTMPGVSQLPVKDAA